jgi:hypothetical protein
MFKCASGPADLNPDLMTAALRRGGVLGDGKVVAVSCASVGNGLVADSYRFFLDYDRPVPDAPASLVGKFPAQDPVSRRSGSTHRLYLKEVSFYQALAASLPMRTPRAYLAEIDRATDDFVLLLEDLGPARQGDQLGGCSLADAQLAMAQAAALHAPRWGDPQLEALDWIGADPRQPGSNLDAMLQPIIAQFKTRYAGALEPEFLGLIDRLPEVARRTRDDHSAPRTLQHGDFRLDNVMFDIHGGREPMATLDWQTVNVGPGLVDVAYFLSAAIPPDQRRAHEQDLVRGYHTELVRLGVRDYDWDQCWRDYRRFAVHGILMGVFSALSVERTERGDALFLKMTRGACSQALDHHTFDFWPD